MSSDNNPPPCPASLGATCTGDSPANSAQTPPSPSATREGERIEQRINDMAADARERGKLFDPYADAPPRETTSHEEENVCKRCRTLYRLDEGCEPTDFCHHCAQAMVEELQAQLEAAEGCVRLAEAVVGAARVLVENWNAQEGNVQTTLGVSMSVAEVEKRVATYDTARAQVTPTEPIK